MQLSQQRGETIEKVFTYKKGKLVRAKFFVYEREGRLKARLVDLTILEQIVGKVTQFLFSLYKKVSENVLILLKINPQPAFAKIKVYDFTGSKPRAPTL